MSSLRPTVSPFILADPQDITRWAVAQLLRREGLCAAAPVTCRTASDLKQAVEHVSAGGGRSVAVLDYTLLDLTEDELLILGQRFEACRLVLFSDQLSRGFLRRMVYGPMACSVLLKDDPLPVIAAGLHDAASGRQYVCPRVRSLLCSPEPASEERGSLTPTEREILRALAMGRTSKEIAATRCLSLYTVATHRKNIFRKLHVNNVQEAVAMAYRLGVAGPIGYCI